MIIKTNFFISFFFILTYTYLSFTKATTSPPFSQPEVFIKHLLCDGTVFLEILSCLYSWICGNAYLQGPCPLKPTHKTTFVMS